MRDKLNWEKHTTEEQRNDPTFATSFSDNLLKNPLAQQKPAEQPKPEPPKEIPPAPITPPEQRPSGLNYRIEAKKAKLNMELKHLEMEKQMLIDKYGTNPIYTELVNGRIKLVSNQLENVEKDDKALGLPHIPMGKNTHTKQTKGFVHNKSTIKIDPKFSRDPKASMYLASVQSSWNNLPDDIRDNISVLNIKYSTAKGRVIQGGAWVDSRKELIMNINTRSNSHSHNFYHEIGHSRWHDLERKHPEKIQKFIEAQKKIGSAPTAYARSYINAESKMENKIQNYLNRIKRVGQPLSEKSKKIIENNRKAVKNLYQNEIHSELNALAMGELPEHLITTSKTNLQQLMNAYKELHEL